MKRSALSSHFLSLVLLVAFQSAPAQEAAKPAETPAPAAPMTAAPDYTIQPGDTLEISVWREKDLQREVLVRPDGGISFPLVGEVHVRDKTTEQVRQEIATRLAKYIPDPVVTVTAKVTAGHKIYVIGKVNRPGEYTASRYVDVMQALSMAGGMTPFASPNSIKILRRVDGKEIVIPFKYNQVESGRKLKQNIILQSGDVVVVP